MKSSDTSKSVLWDNSNNNVVILQQMLEIASPIPNCSAHIERNCAELKNYAPSRCAYMSTVSLFYWGEVVGIIFRPSLVAYTPELLAVVRISSCTHHHLLARYGTGNELKGNLSPPQFLSLHSTLVWEYFLTHRT